MRIELVAPRLPTAGMEVVVAHLARGLERRGHDVGVTCIESRGDLGERLADEGIRVSVVPTPGWATILFPTRLANWFRELAPDVVHIQSGAWLKAARAAHLAGVPRVVYTMHGLFESAQWHRPLLERWAAHYTTEAVAVSAPLVDHLEAVGKARDAVHVLPNGIDTDVFSPGAHTGVVRERFGVEPGTVVIGHVARFSPVKNHELLADAYARVVAANPRVFLALVGDGPLRDATEQRINRLGLRGRVGFFGSAVSLPDIYRDFDVFVLPSHMEQTSISLLEAMSCGLPSVATAVGGTPDVLAHGECGRLVPAGDAPAFANALLEFIDDAGLRTRIGRNARDRVCREYNQELMIQRYEAIYAGTAGRIAGGA